MFNTIYIDFILVVSSGLGLWRPGYIICLCDFVIRESLDLILDVFTIFSNEIPLLATLGLKQGPLQTNGIKIDHRGKT